MKKLFAVCLSLLLLLTAVPMSTVTAAGAEDFTYEILADCVTITGYTGSDTNLIIPDTIEGYPVTVIGDSAFMISPLTSVVIPDSVTTIRDNAFSCSFFLQSVSIGANVTYIGQDAFYWCPLTSLTVAEANPSYCTVEDVLFNKQKTTLILYPGNKSGSFTIPAGVTDLRTNAFAYCHLLTSVVIDGDLGTISDGVFYGCSALTSVTIGDNIDIIGKGAFADCSQLKEVYFLAPRTSVGEAAFSGCRSVTDVYYVGSEADRQQMYIGTDNDHIRNATWHYNYVPEVITSGTSGDCTWSLDGDHLTISGSGAMADYSWLHPAPWGSGITSVTIEERVTTIGANAFIDSQLTEIAIPDSVTTIGDHAFASCYALTSLTLGSSIATIGKDAFYCTGLTELVIPNSVVTIEEGAFSYTTITDLYLGSGIATIGESAFWAEYDLLNNVYYAGSEADVAAIQIGDRNTPLVDSHWYYDYLPDAPISGTSGDCTWTLDGGHLTISGSGAMADYEIWGHTAPWGDAVTEVTLTEGITSIGNCAFSGCAQLTAITLPDSVTRIGESAFSATGLTAIALPDGLVTLGRYAFSNCESLTAIVVPDSVTSIGEYAFYGCKSLSEAVIGDGVTAIEWYTFNNCTSLTTVTIGDSVTSIGDWAFSDCGALTTLHLPLSLTTITGGAFSWCASLTDVYYAGSESDRQAMQIGYTNPFLIDATWHYAGASVTIGDADGDGRVNNRDLGFLQQYLNEWDTTIDLTACDFDGNGRVNNRDLGLLQQLLNR